MAAHRVSGHRKIPLYKTASDPYKRGKVFVKTTMTMMIVCANVLENKIAASEFCFVVFNKEKGIILSNVREIIIKVT